MDLLDQISSKIRDSSNPITPEQHEELLTFYETVGTQWNKYKDLSYQAAFKKFKSENT